MNIREELREDGLLRDGVTGMVAIDGHLTEFDQRLRAHSPKPVSATATEAIMEAATALAERTNLRPDSNAISRIAVGSHFLRVSHQPNYWAGLNIVGLALLAKEIGKPLGLPLLFVGLDYDSAGDRRFRTSTVPSVSSDRVVSLSGAIPRRFRQNIAVSVPRISLQLVERHADIIHQSVRYWRRLRPRLSTTPPASTEIDAHLTSYVTTVGATERLTDGLICGMTQFLATFLGVEVVGVAATDLVRGFSSSIPDLITKLLEDDPSLSAKLVWRVCSSCAGRSPCKVRISGRDLTGHWQCNRCMTAESSDIDFRSVCTSGLPLFVPQVALCDAIDLNLLGAFGSMSYAGGVDHELEGRIRYLQSGGDLPPAYCWDPIDMFSDAVAANKSRPSVSDNWRRGRFSAWWYACMSTVQELEFETVLSARYRHG